ncbi:MAG TPA: metal-dependent hydrolase [Solirubrobacterales bacterium]|nr:metal-dependent hydrolase [Solirubrobacterales bacterium]
MATRRIDPVLLAFALAGTVAGLDLTWALLEGSTGSIAFGLVDEPAHLATCALALLALAALTGSWPSGRFVVAALVASVAIDLDHLPGYLGERLLTGSMPRPLTHGVLLVAALLLVGRATSNRSLRQVSLGIAFGASTHLLRDLATGPGISALWPLTEDAVQVPYAVYAAILALTAVACLPRRSPAWRSGLALTVLLAFIASAVQSAPAATGRVALGVYVRGVEQDPGILDRYAQQVGRRPAIVGAYKRWDVPPFHPPELREIAARGAIPMISWEPWDANDRGYRLSAIASGRHDDFLRRSAQEAKAWGGPILLRFGQEMNGSWATWQRGVDGTTGPRFVAAWRHMVEVFRQAGANNVQWVWCPYVDNGKLPFMRFYPGERWLDWVALDGFNWGAPKGWQSFSRVFDRSYRKLARLTSKPIMIAEVGSHEAGGSKARWLRRALGRQLPRLKRIRAVVWFSATDRADFRVDSSPTALAAFREEIAAPLYSGGRDWLLRVASGAR